MKAVLLRRVSSLRKKDIARGEVDPATRIDLMQATEDLHVFTRLLELCGTLEKENESLSNLITSLGEVNMMFVPEDGTAKKLPN